MPSGHRTGSQVTYQKAAVLTTTRHLSLQNSDTVAYGICSAPTLTAALLHTDRWRNTGLPLHYNTATQDCLYNTQLHKTASTLYSYTRLPLQYTATQTASTIYSYTDCLYIIQLHRTASIIITQSNRSACTLLHRNYTLQRTGFKPAFMYSNGDHSIRYRSQTIYSELSKHSRSPTSITFSAIECTKSAKINTHLIT